MQVIQINPVETLSLLQSEKNALLIDVRTPEEHIFTGFVDPSAIEERTTLLPLKIFPEMRDNPNFDESLDQVSKKFFGENYKNAKIIFLCRSGARSQTAAERAMSIGFKNCYNVTSGFEGDLDNEGRRGNTNGWKSNKLPWRQS